MLNIKKLKGIALGLLLSSTAFADGVWVNGGTTQNNDGYSLNITADLEVTFQKQGLPWGTEVFLVSGYRCQSGGSWQNRTYPEPMSAVAGSTWQRKFKTNVGDRYRGYCSNYEFVFLIKLPDGNSYYDNGGRGQMGFYSSKIPYNSYGAISALPIQVFSSDSEY